MSNPSLLFDGNNFFIRALFSKAITEDPSVPKFELWKYITFDHLLKFVWKFKAKEVVIAIDGPDVWRKIVYKQYKADRQKSRDDSPVDWHEFFKVYHEYITELKEHIPYKIIKCKFCEADDIIAVLARRLEKVIVISNDSDYTQLTEDHIQVYSPHKKEFVDKQPDFVNLHSLNGLKKDNIQNILTPIDWDGKTKPPKFGEAKARKILASGNLEQWLANNNLTERFTTLKKLIDFNYIPDYLVKNINDSYDNYPMPDTEKIADFILKYDWKWYKEHISEVEQRLVQLY